MISRLLYLLMLAIVAFVTALIALGAWHAYDSRRWPTTDGIVTAFYETPHYTYSVSGASYTGSRVSCNEFFDSSRSARTSEMYALRYPLQAKVAVHYSPRNPELAVLETEFDSKVLLAIAFLFLLTVCLAALVRSGTTRLRLGGH